MKRQYSLFLLTIVAIATFAQSSLPKALQVTEFHLSNGMTIWLNEDHSQPKVFGAVVVKAGAADSPNTGIAHYFEHIMFKGTDKIGTVDYAAERPWLDSISAQYDILASTSDAAQRTAIQRNINRLSQCAAEYAVPNDFSNLTTRYGGSDLNAATSYDYTYYYNTFSPQYIRQWTALNSERMLHPVFRLFQGELETVYEEKNRAADDMFSSAMEHVMDKALKAPLPISHHRLYRESKESATQQDARFFTKKCAMLRVHYLSSVNCQNQNLQNLQNTDEW